MKAGEQDEVKTDEEEQEGDEEEEGGGEGGEHGGECQVVKNGREEWRP